MFQKVLLLLLMMGPPALQAVCVDHLDDYASQYQLMHLSTAEQSVAFIKNKRHTILLNQGDPLFDDWTLQQVLSDRAVFVCTTNRAIKIIVYKHSSQKTRPPEVIDIEYRLPILK